MENGFHEITHYVTLQFYDSSNLKNNNL